MGRVLFTAKAEPAKAEPAINWSEIELRLQDISAPARPSDRAAEASLPVAPSATLANDPPAANDPLATAEQRLSVPGGPLDMLSLLAAIPSNRS